MSSYKARSDILVVVFLDVVVVCLEDVEAGLVANRKLSMFDQYTG